MSTVMPSDVPDAFRFDDQAGGFDSRAGLPEPVCRHVAVTLVDLAATGADRFLLDVGAGTGEIGVQLARSGRRYFGLDVSGPMLQAFRGKLEAAGDRPDRRYFRLAQADANATWPVGDDTAALVFLSRAVHLLDPGHVAGEALRVLGRSGGPVVFGRVRRRRDSVRARMRGEMRRLLEQSGIRGRSGTEGARAAVAALEAAGATAEPPRAVARWAVRERPSASLLSWSRKSGLAGVAVSTETKDEVLSRLEVWARASFGDLEADHRSEERYEITVIQTQPDTIHEK